jgi:hypothetical protein
VSSCICSSEAIAPSAIRAGFPGRTRETMKMMTDRPKRLTTPPASRRARYCQNFIL